MLTFGDIANPDAGSFQTVKDPLIPFDDSKPSGELINYPSAVHLHGGHEWSDHFVLFYLYVEPGADHDHDRYLIRRHVWVYKSSTEIVGPQVRLSLCQYYNSSKNDHWATTAYPPNYGYCVDDLGWIITSSDYDGTHAIYDLYDPVNDNHFVGFESEIHSGIINLRRLARLSLFALILAEFDGFMGLRAKRSAPQVHLKRL